ncbi:hypothetical protein FACS189472_17390 [Alphaproteobacteria bacterium]|nr:hypothetical protein FACS189472_17390 [Alphaproteobacteria bacterium]
MAKRRVQPNRCTGFGECADECVWGMKEGEATATYDRVQACMHGPVYKVEERGKKEKKKERQT